MPYLIWMIGFQILILTLKAIYARLNGGLTVVSDEMVYHALNEGHVSEEAVTFRLRLNKGLKLLKLVIDALYPLFGTVIIIFGIIAYGFFSWVFLKLHLWLIFTNVISNLGLAVIIYLMYPQEAKELVQENTNNSN